ncbi:SIMPL domain-containing protein [Microbulbifer sp. 2201CG32-9]|uniref:SIMPL domain-containing protein n=1 Tax=Microbulbifer sp. 2201CG32-9 TaxID=3232309 RepID=UPI00345BCB3F
MKNFILFLVFAIFPLKALSVTEIKGNPDELRGFLYPKEEVVTIFAEAEKKAYTDKALVSLVIKTKEKVLSEAIAKNSQLREVITQALTSSGVSAENINSSKFSTSPQYGWFGKKPSSYEVVNRIAVSITDESQLNRVAEVADEHIEAELSDTLFEHTKKNEFEMQVKELAVQKVMAQKKFYEESLGVKLKPVAFRVSNVKQRATQGALILEEIVVTASRIDSDERDAAYSESREPSFDEVQYEAGIYVDFIIDGSAN